jgi:hypothetical protein
MDLSEPTLLIAIPAATGIGVLYVAYSQYLIGRDKLKLDLYNRRYAIYDSLQTLRMTLAASEFKPTSSEEQLLNYSFRCREALFLFNRKDGILETLEKIRPHASSVISARVKLMTKDFGTNSRTRSGDDDCRSNNLHDIRILSDQLERQLYPYLDFRKIHSERRIIKSVILHAKNYFWV